LRLSTGCFSRLFQVLVPTVGKPQTGPVLSEDRFFVVWLHGCPLVFFICQRCASARTEHETGAEEGTGVVLGVGPPVGLGELTGGVRRRMEEEMGLRTDVAGGRIS
jgi:hypothetical protein